MSFIAQYHLRKLETTHIEFLKGYTYIYNKHEEGILEEHTLGIIENVHMMGGRK